MWCYQKPGFEALLLAELQRQQQCSQFCDTLLRTDGVSVPAHSCILSAISPHISSALSSMPPPPAGQSRLLEFRALGGCTLLHMVRLLYCGEMAGEGEEEKQEAISAAARLGIHGLVEVTDCKRRHGEGEGRLAEVGVQTEPEENVGWRGRWRREVSDTSTFLWKETLSEGGRDTWTQTEELQASTAPSSQPAASYQTIDITTLQSLEQANPTLLPPQIPYVPLSLVYQLDENQRHQPSSAPMQEATAAGHTSVVHVAPPYTSVSLSIPSFSSQATTCAADPQEAAQYITASNVLEDERYEQFQGDIPGYINHFLNPEKEQRKVSSRRRQSRGRQGTGEGGARRGGTGARRAGTPRERTGRRGRGGLTQTVDVQDVGTSKLQMLFLQRWGTRVTRTGQGGGAAGRRLHLKTRELMKPAKSRRRQARGKVWEFGPDGDVVLSSGGGAGGQRGRRNSTQKSKQVDPPAGGPQTATPKPTTSLSSFSSPPMRFYNVHTISTSSPSLQLSPSDGLRSPAASFVSPVLSVVHTTPVPPPDPPLHEEQPEHIDRLLEEVMMGLDILPNNNGALHPRPPVPAGFSTYASSSQTAEKQQGQVVAVARGGGGSSSANSEVPVLQQQGQGELNEMLEHFLMSFEQQVDSCAGREEVEVGGCREAPVRSSQITRQQQSEARRPRARKASAHRVAPPKHSEKPSGKVREPVKQRRKKRFNQYMFTFERKRARARKPALLSDAKSKMVRDQGDKLQQMPVVKLERSGPLPVRVKLQGDSCQSLEVKSRAKRKTGSSAMTHDSLCTKTYPIRSRFKEARLDSAPPPLEEPLVQTRPPSAVKPGRRRGRPRKNGRPLSLCNGESSGPPIQTQPVEPCGTEELPEKTQERHEEDVTVQPQQEAAGPTKRGEKRGAESEEEQSDDATVTKRVCFEQIQQPTSETLTPGSESAAEEIEDVMDVETVSLTSVGGSLQREEVWSEIKQREIEEGSMDEELESDDTLVDMDGDEEEEMECRTAPTLSHYVTAKPYVSPASHSDVNQGTPRSWEEDIDVIGGSSPAPDPVIISWTESSADEKEEEDEDVDVVGEKTDCASALFFATMSKGELVERNYQTELLLR